MKIIKKTLKSDLFRIIYLWNDHGEQKMSHQT